MIIVGMSSKLPKVNETKDLKESKVSNESKDLKDIKEPKQASELEKNANLDTLQKPDIPSMDTSTLNEQPDSNAQKCIKEALSQSGFNGMAAKMVYYTGLLTNMPGFADSFI